MSKFYLLFICFFILLACGGESSTPEQPTQRPPHKQHLILTYNFSENAQGFSMDTADHRVEHELNHSIDYGMSVLPFPFEFRQGIMFTWYNYTDDIKGFIKRKIPELKPNSQYLVEFSVTVITNVSNECSGIGGPPGASVFIKAALLPSEPVKTIGRVSPTSPLEYFISINDGQSGGADVTLLGNIGLNVPCSFSDLAQAWESKTLNNDEIFKLNTGTTGDAWFYVSIDSGHEGGSLFYIAEVEASISEI